MNQNFTIFKGDCLSFSSFVKAPKELIFGKQYMKISALAKFLFVIMLERLDLSVKNKWTDSKGNIYIILTHEEARQLLGCSETKIKSLYAELANSNLIKTKKQGLGKPNLIYISDVIFCDSEQNNSLECSDTPVRTDLEKPSARSLESSLESLIKAVNNKNNNNNKNIYKNHINQSKEQPPDEMIEERKEYKELIKDLIDYNYLLKQDYDSKVLNCIVDASVNMLSSKSPLVKIGKKDIPYEEVKRKIYKLDVNIADNIYKSLKEVKGNIKNPTAYLVTTIYNAIDSACMGFV